MTSNAKDALRKLERRCKDCIAIMDATCQRRINDAVAETKAARKECKRLYEEQEITKAEYKAFKREALRVTEQLRARIQELEREKAALERENATLRTLRVEGSITVITKEGDKFQGQGDTLEYSNGTRNFRVKFSKSK